MTLGAIFYFVVILVAIMACIVCLQYGAVVLLGTLVIIPIITLIFLIIERLHTTAVVECRNAVAEKEDASAPARAVITLTVENKCRILPVSKGIMWVEYKNRFSGEKGKMKVRFSVDASKKRSRRIQVIINHSGNVRIKVKKVKIYDYLSIFAMTIGKDYESQDVLVLPQPIELYLGDARENKRESTDSDRYSVYKKGDDPSEIFAIRDFKEGDRIQHVHWKLSSKVGHMMVKEGSFPIAGAMEIFVDLSVSNLDDMDVLVQGIYSVAMYFIKVKTPLRFFWYDNVSEVIQEEVIDEEEQLYWMFEDLFKSHITEDNDELCKAYADWDEGKVKNYAMYLTVTDHDESALSSLGVQNLQILDLRQ